MLAVRLGVLAGAVSPLRAESLGDPPAVQQARTLAFDGHRDQAIDLLHRRLQAIPDDGDALTLLGIVLSWEDRYDEARAALDQVLRRNPTHYDALRAAIHVELWSDNPGRAEELARRGLAFDPNADDLAVLLERAESLKRRLAAEGRVWQVSAGYSYDGFDDGREDWHEGTLALKRRFRGLGSVMFKYYRARHFGSDGDQFELYAFPKLRDGTWGEVALAASPEGDLYPHYRIQLDLYQSLGSGWEASLGFRHLGFDDSVQIFVGTLTKYRGDWMLIGRTFVTPDEAGVSVSFHGALRHYFRDGTSYFGLRYGYGASREEINNVNDLEIATLASHSVGADVDLGLGSMSIGLNGAFHYGERANRDPLSNWSFGASTALRF